MRIAIAEARQRFDELIGRAEDGEEIVITRDGRGVAVLVPPILEADRLATADEIVAAMRENAEGNRLDGLTIRELIEEGRRH